MNINKDDVFKALLKLYDNGWNPAILDSHKSFVKSAGLTEDMLPEVLISDSPFIRSAISEYKGDIFFKDNEIYFFRTISGDEIEYVNIWNSNKLKRIKRKESKGSIEVGIISPKSDGILEKLNQFTEDLENAFISTKKTEKDLKFVWKEKTSTSRIKEILAAKDSGLKFSEAVLIPEEVQGSDVLKIRENREMLIELSKAGFAIRDDILNRIGKPDEIEKIEKIIEILVSNNLIKEEYILQCKKTRNQLSVLDDKSILESEELSNLKCPTCNTEFKNEHLSPGYSLTDLGSNLSRKSNWMTVWITNLLNEIGIPLESILWNISEAGEEIDLLVEFLGQTWIFELKDKEFGSGNAHALNYRGVIYGANKTIIVTTEIVSPDAKRVFGELEQKQRDRSIPLYLEGIENAKNILEEQVSLVTFDYAEKKLSDISEKAGYSCRTILNHKFNEV